MHEQGRLEQNQNLFTLRVRKASGTIEFLSIGVCFTVVSVILIQAMATGFTAWNHAAFEPASSLVLAAVGYAGFMTSWKETSIAVDGLARRFTATTRNLLTRSSHQREVPLPAIHAMDTEVDERTNIVKVTISRDNHETIRFQLDCNSYGPLEKYLKALLPKIPIITRDATNYEAGMLPGHVSALY